MSLKARIDKLHSDSISKVSSYIVVTKDKKKIIDSFIGTNKTKVIKIAIRF